MKRKLLFVVLCALVFTQGRSLAQDQNANYSITDLGTLPGDFFSEGRDINKRGQVVGDSTVKSFTPPFHSVLFENGEVMPLGTLGGPASFAVAINQRGQVVGASRTVSGQLHAFRWERRDDRPWRAARRDR